MNSPAYFSDLELAQKRSANIRHKTINKLDSYLIEFSRNFESRGGKVIWAPTEKDAQKELLSITKKHKTKLIAGIKSELISELSIAELLSKNKKEYVETDANDPISYTGREPDLAILSSFLLVADPGAVVLCDEYGQQMNLSSSASLRVILAGIEDILPSLDDLELFLSLYGSFAHNTDFPASVRILSGSFNGAEEESAAGTIVILIDNHRTEVLRYREQRKALWCIHCRACDAVCPVLKQDQKTPVQAVTEPFYLGFRDYNPISFKSTLCGACTMACPVKIPLHELLLYNRREAVLKNQVSHSRKRAMNTWKYVMMRRWVLDKSGPALRNYLVRSWLASAVGGKHYLPRAAPKTFKEMWKDERFSG